MGQLKSRGGVGSKGAAVRKDAVREAADSRDPRFIPVLISLLNDDWVIVREAAAAALGKLRSADAINDLGRLLETDASADVRRVACVSLGIIGATSAVPQILAFAVQQPRLRSVALDALTRIGRPAVPAILKAISETAAQRVEGTAALGRIKDRSTVKPLIKLLTQPDPRLRAQAAASLGSIGDTSATERLMPLLSDPEPEVVRTALEALSNLATGDCVGALAPFLEHSDPEHRRFAATGLGKAGSPRAASSLARLTGDVDAEVRQRVAAALGSLESPSSVTPLIQMVGDESPAVRQAAVESLGRIGEPRSLSAIAKALNDDYSNVRRSAAEALGNIGKGEAVDLLSKMLELERTPEVRLAAIRSLGGIGDPRALPALRLMLKEEVAIRCRACVSIGQIEGPEAVAELIDLLRDSAAEVRYHAVIGLGKLGDSRALKAFEQLLDDPDPFVLRGLARALEQFGDKRSRDLQTRAQSSIERINVARRDQAFRQRQSPGGVPASGTLGAPWGLLQNRLAIVALAAVVVVAAGWGILAVMSRGNGPNSSPTPAAVAGSARLPFATAVFSPDGSVISLTTGGLVEEWDVEPGKRIREFGVFEGAPRVVAVSPQGDLVAVAGAGLTVHLLAPQTRERKTLNVPAGEIMALCFDAQGEKIWTATQDRHVTCWDLKSQQPDIPYRIEGTEEVVCHAFDMQAERLAYGFAGGSVSVLNLKTGLKTVMWGKSACTTLEFSRDGRLLAAADSFGVLRIWDTKLRKRKKELKFHEVGPVFSLAWDTKGNTVFAGRVGGVDVVDLTTDQERRLLAEVGLGQAVTNLQQVERLAISPDGLKMVGCSAASKEMAAWRIPEGSPLRPLGVVPK